MTPTDEIAEKVANVLFESLLRSANYVTDTVPNVAGLVNKTTEKAFKSVGKMAEELVSRMDTKQFLDKSGAVSIPELNRAVAQLKAHTRTIRIGDADVKDFEAMLHTEKILYSKIDMRDDNCKMFMYMDKDEQKLEHIIEALRAKRGTVTEISPSLFVQSLKPEHIMAVHGLSDVELELFRHYARETGALFTAVKRPEGNMLILPAEEEEKARRALLYAGWALTGSDGALVREQVEHRLKGRTAINISAEEGERELYVVSRKRSGNYVRITSEDFKVYKANKQISTVSRAAESFHSRCIAACEGISQPVVLTAEEYQSMTQERLAQMPSTELFPQDFDDLVEMSNVNRLSALVSEKMALDDEGNTPIDVTDPSITYAEFAQYEMIADEEELQGRETEFNHFKRAHSHSKERYLFTPVDRNGKSLDFIIAQAETKKREILRGNAFEERENAPSPAKQEPDGI